MVSILEKVGQAVKVPVREGEEKERSRKRKKEIRDQTLFPGIESEIALAGSRKPRIILKMRQG